MNPAGPRTPLSPQRPLLLPHAALATLAPLPLPRALDVLLLRPLVLTIPWGTLCEHAWRAGGPSGPCPRHPPAHARGAATWSGTSRSRAQPCLSVGHRMIPA